MVHKKETSLALTNKTYSLAKPQEVVQMANVLKNYIVKQNLFTNIKGKNYAHVDGWQFAGFLVGMTAAIEEEIDLSNDKEVKWKAIAYLYQGENKTPFRGAAICSNKESSKKGFDEYAVLSMAQTRAIGKAYRNRIGWVMKLAGYEATPSEEMPKMGDEEPQEEKIIQTDKEFDCHGLTKSGCSYGGTLTKAEKDYSIKVFKKPLCRKCQADTRK